MIDWLATPTHRAWLQHEAERLLAFAAASPQQGQGGAYLEADGTPQAGRPAETWITCRMVHSYSLGHLMGVPGSRPLAIRAMSGLTGALRDERHGGWFHTTARDGVKQAYDHAFVVLASSSATVAGLPGGRALLDEALTVLDERFWDESFGLVSDAAQADWSSTDPYRGINANMHTVEALLAAADATGDGMWLERARRIAEFARSQAEAHQWRLPEHFDDQWRPLLEYNSDLVDDPFRPYGATIGHGLEWARLFLHLEATLPEPDDRWASAAEQLYARAVSDGWARDGADGFVYTTGWDGTPVTSDRMHWVAAEAVGAAATLFHRTGEKRYAVDYAQWWDHIAEHFLDPQLGSWHHQLDAGLTVATSVWPGKPDIYHALQATLIPRLPLAPSLATAIAQGKLA
ncbi:MAG: AGE family epimerase/isomerase [Propionibacteriaceae bacterium]|nr:AGE family epimerase/isomerase [Propionibacteriaceae bacterium]